MLAQLDPLYLRLRPSKGVVRLISYGCFEGRPLTTRGRWINPAVFGLLALARSVPGQRRVDRPLYLIGTGRSGTTILGKILSLHPAIAFLNEPKAIWHAVDPGEDLIGSYTRGAARVRLGAEDATPAAIERANRMFGAYLALTRGARLLDKYPELVFRVPFVQALFPEARFLFLVRNGWDTARSIAEWSGTEGIASGGERHDWWGVDRRKWRLLIEQVAAADPDLAAQVPALLALTREEDMAAVEWVLSMRAGLSARAAAPDRVHLVRYEDFVGPDPALALKRLLAFCQLSEDPVVLDYARQVLTPARPAQEVALAPFVRPAFDATMAALGYPPAVSRAGRETA